MSDVTCTPHGKPCWSREAAIGDYDGDLDKEDNEYENPEPYAALWYSELHAMRGTAYTTKPKSIVDAENIALARHFAAVWSRNPEKFRANCTPARADERLPYWASVLGVPTKVDDPRWLVRQRCAAHFKAAVTPTDENVESAVSTLLGDAYVDLTTTTGVDLDTPPGGTYWAGGTAPPSVYDLGGGGWLSTRAHLSVQVNQPTGMSDNEFLETMNVQLYQLLDRMLPAHSTFSWYTGTGFLVGVSRIGFDGL